MKIKKYLFPIFILVYLIFTIVNMSIVYIHNHFRNTSSISCSTYWSNQDCYQKLIQKIHNAKHFILIQQPNVLENGEDVINALSEAENRKILVKFISDKDLKKYNFPLFDDETRLWIDTKPESYEERG
ncbi:MAG: hypothetical protein WAL30_00170 [Candidatus Aquirickettsiella sp.]